MAAIYPADAPTNGNGLPLGLRLGVEKFWQPKHYRLIWAGRGKAFLAAEREDHFVTKEECVAAGQALASELGVAFDEWTR